METFQKASEVEILLQNDIGDIRGKSSNLRSRSIYFGNYIRSI